MKKSANQFKYAMVGNVQCEVDYDVEHFGDCVEVTATAVCVEHQTNTDGTPSDAEDCDILSVLTRAEIDRIEDAAHEDYLDSLEDSRY